MRLKQSFFVFYVVLAGFFFQSCSTEEAEGLLRLKDHEYMPLRKGLYHIYDVTETVYINGPEGEVTRYQVKMSITDSVPGINGYYKYIITRNTRGNTGEAWSPAETWSVTFNQREAVVQEGNINFVKLALPLTANRSWNGNVYNNLGEDLYSIGLFAQSTAIGTFNFTDAIEVIQNDDEDDIVGNDVRKEIYARGVGLVKRSEQTITYCSNTAACIGKQIIESGVVKDMVLTAYGQE